jgi:hypothetical protein
MSDAESGGMLLSLRPIWVKSNLNHVYICSWAPFTCKSVFNGKFYLRHVSFGIRANFSITHTSFGRFSSWSYRSKVELPHQSHANNYWKKGGDDGHISRQTRHLFSQIKQLFSWIWPWSPLISLACLVKAVT